MHNLFFELIRFSIGTQSSLSRMPSAKEWELLYAMAQKQSLIGICFAGVNKLCNFEEEYYAGMNEMLYLTWMGMAAKIQQRNEVMDGYTIDVLAHFRKKGFGCSILKGQAIGKLYGPLKGLRQSGDVDVWLNIARKELFDISRQEFGRVEGFNTFHIHYPIFEDCEVEVHFKPSGLSSPLRNIRLQKFCEKNMPTITRVPLAQDQIDTPSFEFNLVYIMLHNYKHLCGHGVGLRQMMDYYFVLRALKESQNSKHKAEAMNWIEKLGMYKFALASMWVMKDVFGLDDESLICDPDEKLGSFLLNEIMLTGNMGHGDERVIKCAFSSSIGRYFYNLKRSWYLLSIAPHEAVWKPINNFVIYFKKKWVMFIDK